MAHPHAAEAGDDAQLTSLFHVHVLANEVSALLSLAMADAPMRPFEYGICSAIADAPGSAGVELAAQLAMPITTVSDWLASAAERGWVVVEPGAHDRRRREARLTPGGERAVAQARERFGGAYLLFLRHAELDEGRMRETLASMVDAVRAARAELGGGSPASGARPAADA